MPKNLILYGSSGTGKTLLLIEAFRIKIANFLLRKKSFRVLAATYEKRTRQLLLDIAENLHFNEILNEQFSPSTLEDASKGMFIY